MKEKILQLRSEGKTYNEIQKQLGCSKGLIAYYINPDVKSKQIGRQSKNRFARRKRYKMLAGGKCKNCGYNRCLEALHFHHREPAMKKFEIQEAIWGQVKVTEKDILKEINKCDLLCANCHAEEHSHSY